MKHLGSAAYSAGTRSRLARTGPLGLSAAASWPLAAFTVFTVVAIGGFAVFGRNPAILADFPQLITFYTVSFRFFAQAHVLLGAAVLFYALARFAGWSWLPALVAAYAASLASELLGTATGWPFGAYAYSGLLGWKWFNLVPLLIPLSWFLMAAPAFVLSRHRLPKRPVAQVLLGAALLTAWDLALDPAMSRLTSYWSWGESGFYYGMPLVNLVGWMLTGAVIMLLLRHVGDAGWADRIPPRWAAAYYGITLLMPLGMLAAAGMWLAVVVTGAVAGGLVAFTLGERRSSDDGRRSTRADADSSTIPTPDPNEFVRIRARNAGTTADFFRRHSKSFSFAARWFSPEERSLVAGLYAFCRTTDDLVDLNPDAGRRMAEARLNEWKRLVDEIYSGEPSGIDWLDGILMESSARGVPVKLAHDLIDGVGMDVGPVRIQDWDELDTYMYRVASVVGIWMCHLFGVTEPWVHARAAALGQAMQLTNILRDVGEDLSEDRVYLPADALARYGITDLRQLRGDGPMPAAYRGLMLELIGRADALYEFAAPGFTRLPPGFARASAVAAAVYRGIHKEIRRNGYDNIRKRAMTSPARKIVLGALALMHHSRATADRDPVARGALKVAKNATGVALLVAALVGPPVSTARPAPISPAITGAWSELPETEIAATRPPGDPSCPKIHIVREGYLSAVEQAGYIDRTLETIGNCDEVEYRAYVGALVTLRGKHAFWPHAKLRHVREGLGILDRLVRTNPAHVEARYLRLLSSYFLPSILGRTWSVEEDFDALAVLLPSEEGNFPPDLYADMVRFVLDRGRPSAEQESRLRSALDAPDSNEGFGAQDAHDSHNTRDGYEAPDAPVSSITPDAPAASHAPAAADASDSPREARGGADR